MKRINDLRLVSENELEMIVGGGSIVRIVRGTVEEVLTTAVSALVTTECIAIFRDVFKSTGDSPGQFNGDKKSRELFVENLGNHIENKDLVDALKFVGNNALKSHYAVVEKLRKRS